MISGLVYYLPLFTLISGRALNAAVQVRCPFLHYQRKIQLISPARFS
jgi:hypothetical protein